MQQRSDRPSLYYVEGIPVSRIKKKRQRQAPVVQRERAGIFYELPGADELTICPRHRYAQLFWWILYMQLTRFIPPRKWRLKGSIPYPLVMIKETSLAFKKHSEHRAKTRSMVSLGGKAVHWTQTLSQDSCSRNEPMHDAHLFPFLLSCPYL